MTMPRSRGFTSHCGNHPRQCSVVRIRQDSHVAYPISRKPGREARNSWFLRKRSSIHVQSSPLGGLGCLWGLGWLRALGRLVGSRRTWGPLYLKFSGLCLLIKSSYVVRSLGKRGSQAEVSGALGDWEVADAGSRSRRP